MIDISSVTLFEDDNVIAIDKPAGLATIPERFDRDNCLLAFLAAALPVKPLVVHRIDKPVSGVVLFAKTPECHRHLCMQFESRAVHKTYAAVVHGSPPEDEGKVDYPIRRFGSGRMGVDSRRGKPCETRFEVVERCARSSYVRVFPRTGRRHQIRVHLFSLGHAILGDLLYGDREVQAQYPRLMLHAVEATVTTIDGTPLTVHAPLPEAFRRQLEAERSAGPA